MDRRSLRALLCAALTVLFVLSALPVCAATPAEDAHLHFDSNGRFRILNYSDIQDDMTLDARAKMFIRRTVTIEQPDLIVLTGDNVYGNSVSGETNTKTAIAQFMDIFESLGVPVALVFGNHDDDGSALSKEEQMAFYRTYSVCIAHDENSSLAGCGTYYVPIYAYRNRSKVAFNLWMFDTGSTKNMSGYDYMRANQLNWYVNQSNKLKAANGGSLVPSIAFQHIVVKEIYSALKKVSSSTAGAISYDGSYYVLPNTASSDSVLNEYPCPSKYGDEFATVVNQGDVRAIVCGHDHTNQFVVPYQGVDLICTPTCGFSAYGGDSTRGVRVIDLDESTGTYSTRMAYCRNYNLENESSAMYVNKYVKDVALCYFQEKNNGSLAGAHAKAYSCIYNAVDAAHGNGVVLNTDLNAGSTKDSSSSNHVVVYMGYTLTSDPNEALRGLGIFYAGSANAGQYDGSVIDGHTYYLCNAGSREVSGTDGAVNLNRGTSGDALYMYATYDASAGDPLTEIRIVDTGASSKINMADYPGYSLVYSIVGDHTGSSYADLNKTAGGDYVYALYRRGGLAPIRSELNSTDLRGAFVAAQKCLREPTAMYTSDSRAALLSKCTQAQAILNDLHDDNETAAYTQASLDAAAASLRAYIAALTLQTYTISFDANGGTCGTTSRTLHYNDVYGALPTPTRAGFAFLGWCFSQSGGEPATEESVCTEDRSLIAQWQRDGSRIPGDADGSADITLADVAVLLRHLTGGWAVTIDTSAADVNGDGSVNLKDAVLLWRFVVGGWNVTLV